MSNVQFPSTVTSTKRHADKTVSVTTRSNFEMSTEDFSQIDRILGSTGWTMLAPNELQASDIPQEPASSQEGKTKGQRMRAVYFLIWRKQMIDEPFDVWYDRQFETILDKLKEKLD